MSEDKNIRSKASILIVEDNNIVMLELKNRLEDMGYKVTDTASSGIEAVKKAKIHSPDLIMMDIRIKGEIDGIETAGRIRKDLDIPVLYLTAHSDEDTLRRAKFTEPYGFIIKPYEERELFSTIEMALYKHEMERKLKKSEERLKTLLKAIPDIMLRYKNDGTILDYHVHDREKLSPHTELVGEKISDVLEKKLAEKILELSKKAVETNQVQIFEHESYVEMQTVHKEIRILNIRPEQQGNDSDECIVILRDITDRKTAQTEMLKYLSEIKQSKNTLEMKTLELSILNNKLNESEEELRVLNASKDKFFSVVAHDLRTPFCAILGLAEFLSSEFENVSEQELKNIAESLVKSSKSTLNLLENLLQWGGVKTKRIEFNPEPINLTSLIHRMLEQYKNNALSKNISLDFKKPSQIKVYADLNMVETVFRNLISDAIKFTYEGGKVIVSAGEKNGFAEINIVDNSMGMDSETISRLFRTDQNISIPATKNENDSGFGLILCKEFIEMNRGEFFVESEAENGSVLRFTLPLFGN